ncbi:KGGVGR-motif variant AAA ATPase [Streptomyces justiciae]|uniref:KGGVGR-motif variant AAA ATPase n=1 Tax=Streptomyces justiciae TaxID=2780140 RepID=UPI0021190817|nr:TIR domain-containing protein [Streptomyces justiciae]MCW8378767.1 TIR domain-containing protein [Streptomyces justiciae]
MNTGQIVTFYSYKGGVGRSFALANTAVVLARWGYRVLCVDWDLEAPGLSYYFDKHLAEPPRAGLLEMIEEARTTPETAHTTALRHRTSVRLPEGARLDLITAGRKDDDSYISRLQQVDWEALYEKYDFGATLETWREEWMREYDLVLVDSRTGITDSGGICTAQVPDVLVFAYTANDQNVDGVLEIVDRAMKARDGLPYDRPRLLTVPLLSRFDAQPEYKEGERWRRELARRMEPRLRDWAPRGSSPGELLQRVTIPYFPVWSFGELLPALSESPRNAEQVTYSIASLAALLARRLEDVGLLIENRDSYVEGAEQAARRDFEVDVFISHSVAQYRLARQLQQLFLENGVTSWVAGENPEHRAEFVDRCRHLVMIVDEGGEDPTQNHDTSLFLRRSVNAATERLTLPVVTSSAAIRQLPRLAQSLQAFNLEDGTLSQAARAIAARLRQESRSLRPHSSRGGGYDVYLSYAHADENWTLALAENLKRLGLTVFVDAWEVQAGDHWPSRLDAGLRGADTVVAVVSTAWSRSEYTMHEFELAAQRTGRQQLIPVLVGDVVPPPPVAERDLVDFRDAMTPREYLGRVQALARRILHLRGEEPLPPSGSVVLPDSMF